MHKWFKCLDIATSRIYISSDVVFYEIVYPFSKLNPNAGARSEILLLSSHSQPCPVPGHRDDVSVGSSSNVHVYPVATNGVFLS
jgi:hypothetical protein